MLNFNISLLDLIKFPYFLDTPKRKVWGERRPKDMVTLQIILIFTLTLTCPKTFTQGHVSVNVCIYIYIYTLQQDKCKCKKIGRVNVNDLHLH
jgi:hypothetical protein